MIDIASLTSGLECDEAGIWLSPQRTEVSHPDECQDWYLAVEDNSYWFRHRAACIVECLRSFPPGGPVFDIGGGNGHVSLAMMEAGFEPVLLEPSIDGARNALARGVSPIICATLEDAGLTAGNVSAVGAFDVLEHIEDDKQFLQQVREALMPGGRVYLTVPALRLLWSDYDHYVGHFRRYALRELSKLLQDSGFDVEFASYLYMILPLPIFFMRSIPSRLGRGQRNFERFRREHAAEPGLASRMMESVLGAERRRLAKRKTLPCGSSCLVVARRG